MFRLWGLGFEVWGLGFGGLGVWGFGGLGVWGFGGLGVWGFGGLGVWGFGGLGVWGFGGLGVWGFGGLGVWGFGGLGVWGFGGLGVWGFGGLGVWGFGGLGVWGFGGLGVWGFGVWIVAEAVPSWPSGFQQVHSAEPANKQSRPLSQTLLAGPRVLLRAVCSLNEVVTVVSLPVPLLTSAHEPPSKPETPNPKPPAGPASGRQPPIVIIAASGVSGAVDDLTPQETDPSNLVLCPRRVELFAVSGFRVEVF